MFERAYVLSVYEINDQRQDRACEETPSLLNWNLVIDLKRRLRLPPFFPPRENILEVNVTFSEIHGHERMWLSAQTAPCQARCRSFVATRDKWERRNAHTAQITHTLLFVAFRNGNGNCRFTPKSFPGPMVEQPNGECYNYLFCVILQLHSTSHHCLVCFSCLAVFPQSSVLPLFIYEGHLPRDVISANNCSSVKTFVTDLTEIFNVSGMSHVIPIGNKTRGITNHYL